jgi:hypothetical protein
VRDAFVSPMGLRSTLASWTGLLWRDVPYSSIQIALYEAVRASFRSFCDGGVALDILAGAVAESIAAVVTTPPPRCACHARDRAKPSKLRGNPPVFVAVGDCKAYPSGGRFGRAVVWRSISWAALRASHRRLFCVQRVSKGRNSHAAARHFRARVTFRHCMLRLALSCAEFVRAIWYVVPSVVPGTSSATSCV